MTSHGRVTLAFAVAPLATPFVLWLGELFLDYPGSVPSGLSGSLLVNLVLALPVAYFAELILGIPLWRAFIRFHIASPWAFLLGGAFLGLVPAAILPHVKWLAAALCALAGAVPALVFRLIVPRPQARPA